MSVFGLRRRRFRWAAVAVLLSAAALPTLAAAAPAATTAGSRPSVAASSYSAGLPVALAARGPRFPAEASSTAPQPVTVSAATATAPPPSPAVQAATVSALAAGGIPVTALAAYQQAATTSASKTHPGCHIPWPLLAAIGRVESNHGRFHGAVLHTDGTSTPKIIGIALDGVGTALILDTDHGVLDGDPVFDRAVGPMQFIPSTWAKYGVDGNGDHVIDPFNIFDAAAAAADYLCAAGGDLSTAAGQQRAVLSYNHSTAYLTEVLGLETSYAAGVVTVPVFSAPATDVTPTLPPVNPASPPAGTPSTSAPVPSSSAPSSSAPTTPVPSSSPVASCVPTAPVTSSATPAPTTAPSATPSPTPTGATTAATTSAAPSTPAPGCS